MSRLITASGHPVTANMLHANATMIKPAGKTDITFRVLVPRCKRRTSVVLITVLIMTNASAVPIW